MYWRIVAAIVLLVSSSYLLGKRSYAPVEPSSARSVVNAQAQPGEATDDPAGGETAREIAFTPSGAPLPLPEMSPAAGDGAPPEERFSLDFAQEAQRIAAAAGVSIGAIQVTDRLPPQSLMGMTFRRGQCVLLLNAAIPFDGMVLNNLSAYGMRQLVFTLGHETGHCYVLTQVARRDPAFLPSLSPPGKAYSFDQYVAMMGKYSEYPDLNRWNEEWADTFAAFILHRIYGRDFAMLATDERFSLRKDQERNGSVLVSNVYGGHASLSESGLYTIETPLEIANLVKLGRLNTRR